ncbi:3-deoxy-7-phosphoheptulonate synthase [Catenuloplanes atrovinosus]|uniref:Phospho-2-dehydro-3-deoxyheptonate aldolase n=1 Tax=Catenuloplanes atrovinosus TaxID=137266 RepID=A0AAE3YHQ9_9ACTN|nr:3-deoxy-7-phosphoheptulonate synthase [Catenuloplanes atrovinosus]MDR7273620.1 3-deoxy-7-phosphoheptulonate synthase [Catenuloplanes atrovinosus]
MTAPPGVSLSEAVSTRPARQQPAWPDPDRAALVRAELRSRPVPVTEAEVLRLRALLAGRPLVLQAGDCAEEPAESTPEWAARKARMLDVLAGALEEAGGSPVTRVGRLAGQYAKPRSQDEEVVDGRRLPVYRGHLVNSPHPDPGSRRPDPLRMLTCHDAARRLAGELHPRGIWLSHEALVLDFEVPQVRDGRTGCYLGSAHWPWLGYRTGDPAGAHAALLAGVVNPVACKVGPGTTPDELTALCALIDPDRLPGRLTFIARMGLGAIDRALPPLVAATRAAGHPVTWMCDPMHGNTVVSPDGRKTRRVPIIAAEVRAFRRILRAGAATAGGLHLEVTPLPVRECVDGDGDWPDGAGYLTACDPRLTVDQALRVVAAWR